MLYMGILSHIQEKGKVTRQQEMTPRSELMPLDTLLSLLLLCHFSGFIIVLGVLLHMLGIVLVGFVGVHVEVH
jgi:hypothetical protein